MRKVLFIYPLWSSFVETDFKLLSEKFFVVRFQYKHRKSVFHHIIEQVKLFFFLLINIMSSDAVYIWFADYHSFLPILFAEVFRLKSFLVLGGYDVAYIPELDYGSLNKPARAFCAKYSIHNAALNLAVSEFVYKKGKEIAGKAKIEVLYNGVEIEKCKSDDKKTRSKILTVGIIDSLERIKLKGIDVFLEAAKRLPDLEFVVIGVKPAAKELLGEIPQNVKILGFVEHDKLFHYYSETKVYCQFSLVESFSMTLAEAMYCGCTPVVSDAGALPEVAGESGLIVKSNSAEEFAEKTLRAFNKEENENLTAKERIENNFSINQRKKRLFELMEKIS